MKIKIKKGNGSQKLDYIAKEFNKKIIGKVGWFPDLKYETGESIAGVAATQEFGLTKKNIPPRPFMRPTIKNKEQTWKQTAIVMAKRIALEKSSYNDFLDVIGMQVSSNVQETIKSIQTPALRNSTIKARLNKKRDKKTIGLIEKPLVDTGTLLNTITNVVEKK
jgi:hypothetical protein